MLKRLALLTVAAALVAPASAGAEVTIKLGSDHAKYRETLYPQGFRIKGKTGTYRGPVTLELDGFPHEGSFTDYTSTSTNDEGEYVFPDVVVGRNAVVRVRAGNERSKSIQLYVHPGVKRKEKLVASYRVRVSFTYLGHPGFAPPPDAFFVYLSWTKEPRKVRRLGGARTMKKVGDGQWRYTGTVKLPRGDYRYGLLYCTRGLSGAGYGRFWRIDRHCGEKVVPFPNPN